MHGDVFWLIKKMTLAAAPQSIQVIQLALGDEAPRHW